VDGSGSCAGACLDVELALAFVDGELAAERRAEIEQRIDACAGCRNIVAEAARGAGGSATEPSNAPTISQRRAKRRAQPPSPESLEPGVRVGRYVVERAIGAGGMGVVNLARDPELRRAVVIKLVRALDDTGEAREALEVRLEREAQAMAQLSHPNVVQIFEIGRHGERVFLAMELIAGQTFDAWLIERPRSADEILAMVCQAGAGLEAAHRAGVVHRDFKPSNVLVNDDGIAKVTGFGLARAVDARSDQHALAITLLDALLGQAPTSRTVLPESPALDAALGKAGVRPRVRQAIARALLEDPAARFPSLADLMRELAPSVERPRRWPLLVGVALCGLAIIVWLATRR